MNKLTRIGIVLLLGLAPVAAFALKSDRDKPMDVAADSLETSEGQAETTLRGNVHVTQGTLDVRSDQARVLRGTDAQIKRVVLNGGPARLEQDLDEGGRLKARAKEIDYDISRDLVVLTGAVVIDQPRGELRGEKITYELATGRMTGSGEGSAGRVQLRMNPTPKDATPKDASKKDAPKEKTS